MYRHKNVFMLFGFVGVIVGIIKTLLVLSFFLGIGYLGWKAGSFISKVEINPEIYNKVFIVSDK